jgi:hypothetical protein
MSPFFKDAISALLQCAARHATYDHAMVQISVYEAVNDLVRAASRDTLDVVAQLIQVRGAGGGREFVIGNHHHLHSSITSQPVGYKSVMLWDK